MSLFQKSDAPRWAVVRQCLTGQMFCFNEWEVLELSPNSHDWGELAGFVAGGQLEPHTARPTWIRPDLVRVVDTERFRMAPPPEPAKPEKLTAADIRSKFNLTAEALDLVFSFNFPRAVVSRITRRDDGADETTPLWDAEQVQQWFARYQKAGAHAS